MQSRVINGRFRALALLALIVIVSSVVLFWRLDGTMLWRDETTTANWAKMMVEQRSLVPHVFDGKTLAVQGFDAHDFNDSLTPGMQGWLQFYVTAASFQLFGVSTFTARLPFAIIGLLSVCVMWQIGRRLYGNSYLTLLFPALSIFSIWYVHLFRQSRYYGLVFFFSAMLLYEFVRYLQQRDLATHVSWYLRVSLWSAGIYLSHYLGFAALYTALCLFVLLMRDRVLLWRWSLMTAVLAILFGAEFFAFHFDFASTWGKSAQPWQEGGLSLSERIAIARRIHAEELLRMVPILFLIPGLFYMARRNDDTRSPFPLSPILLSIGIGIVTALGRGSEWFPLAVGGMSFAVAIMGYRYLRARRSPSEAERAVAERLIWLLPVAIAGAMVMGFAVEHSTANFPLYSFAEVLVLGLFLLAVLRWVPKEGEAISDKRALMLLGVLIMVVSVAVTAGIGLDKGLPRYYYQVLMAATVLSAMVTAEAFRWRPAAGVLFLACFLVWPTLSYNISSSFAVVERQLSRNREVDYPVVDFFKTYAQAGDRLMVYRNVKGMMLHFYLPELHWVGQLDANHPAAARFKDRLPATAYDTVEDVQWIVVWNSRGIHPKGLDERYDLVWEYAYSYPASWWDKVQGLVDSRDWKIYKRRDFDRGITGTPYVRQ